MEGMDINYLAMVVAAIIPLFTGFIWYHPKVMGTAWMKESGMTEEKAKSMNPGKTYGLAVVFAFLAAFFLWGQVMFGGGGGEIHGAEPYMTFKHGAFHGALISVMIVLPVFATNALFEQKSFKYVAINVGYWVVTFALMSGLLNAWT